MKKSTIIYSKKDFFSKKDLEKIINFSEEKEKIEIINDKRGFIYLYRNSQTKRKIKPTYVSNLSKYNFSEDNIKNLLNQKNINYVRIFTKPNDFEISAGNYCNF